MIYIYSTLLLIWLYFIYNISKFIINKKIKWRQMHFKMIPLLFIMPFIILFVGIVFCVIGFFLTLPIWIWLY
jgi:hypothetical protein